MPPTNPYSLNPNPSAAALPYNPALSLWLSVDPLSDKYPNLSPYTYCANNPVGLVDKDGREWLTTEDAGKASEMRTIAYAMINYYKDQTSQYQDDPDCSEYVMDLHDRIGLLQEGINGLDNMENDVSRKFTFNEVNRGDNCFVSKNVDDKFNIIITIHSDDLIETRWHECAHVWDYLQHPENEEHCFDRFERLGSSDSYKPISEGKAYKQEFSFSQQRFNGISLPQFEYQKDVNWNDIQTHLKKQK